MSNTASSFPAGGSLLRSRGLNLRPALLTHRSPTACCPRPVVHVLCRCGVLVGPGVRAGVLNRWSVSNKQVYLRAINKYTDYNIGRWSDFVAWVSDMPVDRLKFMDEVHFRTKGVCACVGGWVWVSGCVRKCRVCCWRVRGATRMCGVFVHESPPSCLHESPPSSPYVRPFTQQICRCSAATRRPAIDWSASASRSSTTRRHTL